MAVVLPDPSALNVTMRMAPGIVYDLYGNPSDVVMPTTSVQDLVPPRANILVGGRFEVGLYMQPYTATLTWSEAVRPLKRSDISVYGGNLTGLTALSQREYKLEFMPVQTVFTCQEFPNKPCITVDVYAGAALDLAGNPSDATVHAAFWYRDMPPSDGLLLSDASMWIVLTLLFIAAFLSPCGLFIKRALEEMNKERKLNQVRTEAALPTYHWF
mmetsp:Transcript_36952/g.116242  ORF Transcript_36952/g.116242 Transcript_36952/m.116242 type:complete len:214 (+) Transcript_36952:264-905(+)